MRLRRFLFNNNVRQQDLIRNLAASGQKLDAADLNRVVLGKRLASPRLRTLIRQALKGLGFPIAKIEKITELTRA